MPHERDENPVSGTLPPAELNPLLNPLLAENMGRWAEIYFTSPPEHREQAVLELLRELEAERSRQQPDQAATRSSPTTVSNEEPSRPAIFRDRFAEAGSLVRCAACGRDNPPSHRFCGMCGAPMAWESDRDDIHERAEDIENPAGSEPARRQWRTESNPRDFQSLQSNGNELSLFQGSPASEEDHSWAYEPQPARSYRFYIGAILAVIIAVLGYMAWRGTQASQTTHQMTAAPPAPVNDATPPAPSNADGSNPAGSPNTPASPLEKKAETAAPTTATTPAAPKSTEATKAPEPAPAKPSVTSAPASTATGNGSEELALAQHYLNGAGGHGRDTAEAAKWLWKSIAKHNGEATILLADLYLRGDGVSKNCDQARILLDSAARKGVSGAGERLRNLQAFGCQ